jgi:hypothetical protein
MICYKPLPGTKQKQPAKGAGCGSSAAPLRGRSFVPLYDAQNQYQQAFWRKIYLLEQEHCDAAA